jgi:toxin CcdB
VTKQFDIVRNKIPESKAQFPYFLVLQHDFLSDLKGVVVVPLRLAYAGSRQEKLAPEIEMDGKLHAIVMPSLASIQRKMLGATVTNIADRREDIIRAYDIIVSGV